jgi:hypothetical protein
LTFRAAMMKKTFRTAQAIRKKAFLVRNVSRTANQEGSLGMMEVVLPRLAKNSGSVRPSAKFPVAEYAAAEP